MDWGQLVYQLNDLPRTYKRDGTVYTYVINSIAAGMYKFTKSSSDVIAMATFTNASGKWLNVWGELLGGITRLKGMSDLSYGVYITDTLLAYKGPPVAIENYIQKVYTINNEVFEYFPAVGWSIELFGAFPSDKYNELVSSLDVVRPAGVPLLPLIVLDGGLFMNTVNYLGGSRVTGSYIGNPSVTFSFNISPSTNNIVSTLPTLYLTDPTLNPN